ncbi:penicillin G acylase [Thermoplasma volcanium GSS1]|uniref:Penicillin G acylase n=1 Tax=Thermoplasma volcanium (strain ATCC 51530 / DSM 4299 / JCM 9571 / NBRC 15438 / GSS1) TaxID=273116 RepID=Q979D7_THEVO|nr:penicillin acylase family protein [Thermoplasma volcanium]BAB60366.1 penicillin G acylase [Thermoplasma volcanium GSS1]
MRIKLTRLVITLVILIVLLFSMFTSIGPLPPLAKILNPSTGIFSAPSKDSSYSYIPGAENISIQYNGQKYTVLVFKQADGFIGVASNNSNAVFYEQGYLEAQYRLEELDFLKRTALGNLSAVVGQTTLSTDILMRELQFYNTAVEEYQNLPKTSFTYESLHAFVSGINAYIQNLTYSKLPILFKILNYEPHKWNVTDVLAVQQLFLWENSAGGFDPVYFNIALEKMPESLIKAIYPAYPAGIQHPIVPYNLNPSVYNETGDISNLSLYTPSFNVTYSLSASSSALISFYDSAQNGYLEASRLFTGNDMNLKISYSVFHDFGSNDWAVNGIKTHNTSALLANDPHLTTSLPPIWMGFQLVAPGMNVIGVTFPGFPGVILGHNPYLAWGATNGQIQETYFYAEETSSQHPNSYFFNGSWIKFKIENETIQVKGSKPYFMKIYVAKNGVVVENSSSSPIAIDWTGFMPTYEITFFLHIDRAQSVSQFRQNLTQYFKVAIQNWAVADSRGNIGIFPYGLYPIVERGNPRGILPGTGQYDWMGFVPVSQLPYLYDPQNGFVFSDNQITVSPNYPYYIGWDYESGYRADEAYTLLNSTWDFNSKDMEMIQLNVHDFTTDIFLHPLLKAMDYYGLSGTEAYHSLEAWNGDMLVNSTAATIYYYWIRDFVNDTFMPYMQHYGINESDGLYQVSFFLGSDDYYHGPLIEDLVNWTLTDPNINYFNNPVTGQKRNESQVMAEAMNQTLAYMTKKYGPYSTSWEWGNIHKRYLSSFFGINAMNSAELPAAGDGNTLNAAYGTISDFGPSWRMVVNMSHPVTSVGIYPGGISENPLSPYYDNTFVAWNNGQYYTLISSKAPEQFFYLYRGGEVP